MTRRGSSERDARRGLLLSVLFSFAVFCTYAVTHYKPYTFALYDSGWHVHQVMSLINDGDIDLRNQLGGDVRRTGGLIALGKQGEWFPMHESLLPALAVPFYLIFGINGCLVFNLLTCVLLVSAVYLLLLEVTTPLIALCAASLASYCSLLLPYSYDFSNDVLAACFLMFAYLAASKERAWLSGIIWGISIFGRAINVVTLPAFLLVLILSRKKIVDTYPHSAAAICLQFAFGMAPAAIGILLLNEMMFGDFFTFRYSRWVEYTGGSLEIRSQWNEHGNPFLQGAKQLLLDREKGILISQPFLLLSLLGFPLLWRSARRHAVGFLAIFVCMLVFFAQYKGALNTTDGNRYFIFPLLLCALPLATLLESVGTAFRARMP